MDAILKSLYTAIEMAHATPNDPAYVARRLEEIEWGVDALAAENARLRAALTAVSPLVGAEWRQLSSERQQAWSVAIGEGE